MRVQGGRIRGAIREEEGLECPAGNGNKEVRRVAQGSTSFFLKFDVEFWGRNEVV